MSGPASLGGASPASLGRAGSVSLQRLAPDEPPPLEDDDDDVPVIIVRPRVFAPKVVASGNGDGGHDLDFKHGGGDDDGPELSVHVPDGPPPLPQSGPPPLPTPGDAPPLPDTDPTRRVLDDVRSGGRQRQSACGKICMAFAAVSSIFVKTFGCVLIGRQIGTLVTDALQAEADRFLAEGDPEDIALKSTLCMLGGIGLHVLASDFFVRPAFSALLTYSRRGPNGEQETVRIGGRAHGLLTAGLAQVGTAFTLVDGFILSAWDLPRGAAQNAVVIKSLIAALKQFIYVAGRGASERVVMHGMPARDVVDHDGDPVPPELVQEHLTVLRAIIAMAPMIGNAMLVIQGIMDRDKFTAGPLQDYFARTIAIDSWVGSYEAIASTVDLAVLWLTARTIGWDLHIHYPQADEPQPAPAAGAPRAAEANDPAEDPRITHAREFIASLEKESTLQSRLREARESLGDEPQVFRAVGGFRVVVNLALNPMLHPKAVAAMDAVPMPTQIRGVIVFLGVLGLVEDLLPLRISNGFAAQAAEGVADRDLFDLLHCLCWAQDEVWESLHPGEPNPQARIPVLERRLEPWVVALIEDNPDFAAVIQHLKDLRLADKPRRAQADRSNDRFIVYEPTYPPRAAREKFGRILASHPFLPDSRIKRMAMLRDAV